MEQTKPLCGVSVSFQQVPLESGVFGKEILPILQGSYLDPASKNCFRYSQAIVVKNEALKNKLNSYIAEKRKAGYNQEELEESYGFLLYETESEAKQVCQKGVQVGNSKTTTLGNPSSGVYLSRYSDYIHPRPWYHGKSGHIVIVKVLKGRVKSVAENYTKNYTIPSPGFDCHISGNVSKVSPTTSHFQTFELTQFYVYELKHGNAAAQYPRQIYPTVIVTFQYNEPKCIVSKSEVKSKRKTILGNQGLLYTPWKGQLINSGSVVCSLMLKSFHGLLPVKLPAQLEIKYVVSLTDLKKKLAEAVFRKECYREIEVCFEDTYCSLFNVVKWDKNEHQLDHLAEQLKRQKLAFVISLPDRGFLLIVPSSALKSIKDYDLDMPASLHALFIFPSSRRVCMTGQSELKLNNLEALSSKVASLLPGLHYAVTEANKFRGTQKAAPNTLVEKYLTDHSKLSEHATSKLQNANNDPWRFYDPSMDAVRVVATVKCPQTVFSQLQLYFNDPDSYVLQYPKPIEQFDNQTLLPNSHFVGHSTSQELANCILQKNQCDSVCPLSVPITQGAEINEVSSDKNGTSDKEIQKEFSIRGHNKFKLKKTRRKNKNCLHKGTISTVEKKVNSNELLSVGTERMKKKVTVHYTRYSETQSKVRNRSETTVKLTDLGFPHRQKRGAEVLTAEFISPMQILDVQIKPTDVETEVEEAEPVPKRRRSRKATAETGSIISGLRKRISLRKPPAKKSMGETEGGTTVQQKSLRNKSKESATKKRRSRAGAGGSGKERNRLASRKSNNNPSTDHHVNMPNGTVIASEVNSREFTTYENIVTANTVKDWTRKNSCASDALSLLAELALSSINRDMSHQKKGLLEEGEDEEAHCFQISCGDASRESTDSSPSCENGPPEDIRMVCDHGYHRVSSCQKVNYPCVSKPESSNTPVQNKRRVSSKHNRLESYRTQLSKRLKLSSSCNNNMFISMEHSYARSLPENSANELMQEMAQDSLISRNETEVPEVVPNSLVKPLTQESENCKPQEHEHCSFRKKGKSHTDFLQKFNLYRTVYSEGETVKITRTWKEDEEYLFELDSKYTNDPLEKTVNRALHGPWDQNLQNSLNEVKLILHMWMALFYTRSSKMLSAPSRKVVEHNNPAKFVSINSLCDPVQWPQNHDDQQCLPVTVSDSDDDEGGDALHIDEQCISDSLACDSVLTGQSFISDNTKHQPTEPEDCSSTVNLKGKAKHGSSEEIHDGTGTTVQTGNDCCMPSNEILDAAEIHNMPLPDKTDDAVECEVTDSQNEVERFPLAQFLLSANDSSRRILGFSEHCMENKSNETLDGVQKHFAVSDIFCASESTSTANTGVLQQCKDSVSKISCLKDYNASVDKVNVRTFTYSDQKSTENTDILFCDKSFESLSSRNVNRVSQHDLAQDSEREDLQVSNTTEEKLIPDLILGSSQQLVSSSNEVHENLQGYSAVPEDMKLKPETNSCQEISLESNQEDDDILVGAFLPENRNTDSLTESNQNVDLEAKDEYTDSQGEDDVEDHGDDHFIGLTHDSPVQAKEEGEALPNEKEEGKVLPDKNEESKILSDEKEEGEVVPDEKEEGEVVPNEKEEGEILPDEREEGEVLPDDQEEGEVLPDDKEEGEVLPDDKEEGEVLPGDKDIEENLTFQKSTTSGEKLIQAKSIAETLPLSREADVKKFNFEICGISDCELIKSTDKRNKLLIDEVAIENMYAESFMASDEILDYEVEDFEEPSDSDAPVEHFNNDSSVLNCKGETEVTCEDVLKSPVGSDHLQGQVELSEPEDFCKKCDKTVKCLISEDEYTDSLNIIEQERKVLGVTKHCKRTKQVLSADYTKNNANERDFLPVAYFENEAEFDWHYKEKGCLSYLHDYWEEEKLSSTPRNASDSIPPFVLTKDPLGNQRTYRNFTITKKQNDIHVITRTSHGLQREVVTGECDIMSLQKRKEQIRNDYTQKTVDLEYLWFLTKLQEVVKNKKHSAKGLCKHLWTAKRFLPSRKTTSDSPHDRMRCMSPLLMTVTWKDRSVSENSVCPKHSRSNSSSHSSHTEDFKDKTNMERRHRRCNLLKHYHFKKLNYASKLKEAQSEIFEVINKCTEYNLTLLNAVASGDSVEHKNSDSGTEAESRRKWMRESSHSRRKDIFQHMINKFCKHLHVELNNVVRENCRVSFLYYILETGDGPFFLKVKDFLKKEGHIEIDPRHLSETKESSTSTVFIVIRNEDIRGHFHQIPNLLALKYLPNVVFAGIDCPEDLIGYTYQELFLSGGFVVSEGSVVESLTLGQLRKMLEILESLKTDGKWKWLLHYRESKRLKEVTRMDYDAYRKSSMLNSFQEMNIVEVLPYHACDSQVQERSDYLSCLISLQVQNIRARFAVFLTEKINIAREEFENNGIFVTDVERFVNNIHKLAASFSITQR
ncbi:protein TASOR 2 [Protopterus annectens]|uniref:protein TASOR 2 n=1 Tax=Protopterus annectens TaxID=7888 RepID=UPI001CFBACA5|nr:protein TASOR 2 [Protopterus annectens]